MSDENFTTPPAGPESNEPQPLSRPGERRNRTTRRQAIRRHLRRRATRRRRIRLRRRRAMCRRLRRGAERQCSQRAGVRHLHSGRDLPGAGALQPEAGDQVPRDPGAWIDCRRHMPALASGHPNPRHHGLCYRRDRLAGGVGDVHHQSLAGQRVQTSVHRRLCGAAVRLSRLGTGRATVRRCRDG